MKPPILITGCARSGTSMTAGIIARCGALGGDMFGPNRNNPRGMYENKVLREGVVKPLLRSIGADPRGQAPLPDIVTVQEKAQDSDFVFKLRETVEGIVHAQGVGEEDNWFYKGAKLCLIWPIWNKAFPDAKWVIVRRRNPGIVASCMRTSFMRAYQTSEGWQGWVQEHLQRFREMKAFSGLKVREVWPEKMLNNFDGLGNYPEVVEWLGLTWNEGAISEFVEPRLWERRK